MNKIEGYYSPLGSTETNDLELISPRRVGNNMSFDFFAWRGNTFVVEYTDGLNPPNWHTLQTIDGDGTSHTISDPIGSNSQRFYRVRWY